MNDDNVTIWNCPRPHCTGKLIKRVSKTGNHFLGCTRFPYCRYTQKDDTVQEDERYPDGQPDSRTRWD